jgi:hypothetical protein
LGLERRGAQVQTGQVFAGAARSIDWLGIDSQYAFELFIRVYTTEAEVTTLFNSSVDGWTDYSTLE